MLFTGNPIRTRCQELSGIKYGNEEVTLTMDMEEIQTFIVLAGCRNFTKTAETLHVVQSTISNRIRSLEEYTGTQLVLRYKNGIHLTAAGEIFLNYASQINLLNQKALQEIHMQKRFQDHLRIGCVRWVYDQWLEDILIQFGSAFPDISLHVEIDHSRQMLPMLHQKVLDFVFSSYELNNNSISSLPIKKTDILFVGSAGHFSHLRGGICKSSLLDIPLIHSDIWDNYMEDISENALNGKMLFQVNSNMLDSAKSFCLAGAGCCFLPRTMVETELVSGTLIEIPIQDLPSRTIMIYVSFQKQRMESMAMKSWMNFLSKTNTLLHNS